MQDEIAISVKNVSKTFKIPHEKVSSIRGAVTSVFSRNKGYEEFKALDDVSFEACPTHYNSFLNCCGRVKKGEFFGEKKTLAEACFEALTNDDNSYNIKVLKTPALTISGTAGFRF